MLQQGSKDDWDIDGSKRRKKVKNNSSGERGGTKASVKRGEGGKGGRGVRGGAKAKGKGKGVRGDKISIDDWGADIIVDDVIGLLGKKRSSDGHTSINDLLPLTSS